MLHISDVNLHSQNISIVYSFNYSEPNLADSITGSQFTSIKSSIINFLAVEISIDSIVVMDFLVE